MRQRAAQPPTFEDLLARVRDEGDGHRGQILEGSIHLAPPPCGARAHVVAEIVAMLVAGSALGDPVPAGWSFLSNVEIAPRDESLLVADVAGWRLDKERLAAAATPIRLLPAWVCEVLDDASRRFTLTAKRRAYGEMGIPWLWIADPDAQVLEIFQNQKGRWLLAAAIGDEGSVVAPPFEGFRFDASELWIPPPPRSARNGAPPSSRSRH